MFYTANPCADAERYEDAMEAACAAAERAEIERHEANVRAFIDAAQWGKDEPLDGATVDNAVYDVGADHPELMYAFFYRAAAQTSDPVMRAMVAEVADAWARIKERHAQ